MFSIAPPNISVRDKWAYAHAHIAAVDLRNKSLTSGGNQLTGDLSPLIPGSTGELLGPKDKLETLLIPNSPDVSLDDEIRVAIVGAGAAGLFTGMLFDYLNKNFGLGINYDILEAAEPGRVGGRLFSYNFLKSDPAAHCYYDVGAMRFPKNPVMQRVFDLFAKLDMKYIPPESLGPNTPNGSLIKYYMSNPEMKDGHEVINPDTKLPYGAEFWSYNNNTLFGDLSKLTLGVESSDPFSINSDKGIDTADLRSGPNAVFEAAVAEFRAKLQSDLEKSPPGTEGWDLLMKYDMESTRQFLSPPPPELPTPQDQEIRKGSSTGPNKNWQTIDWMETFNGGTNWYDQANSETILESMDFDYPEQKPDWYCIMGGAQQLAIKMQDRLLNNKPKYFQNVTKIRTYDASKPMAMEVTYTDKSDPTKPVEKVVPYSGVFASPTFGCMRTIDTTGTAMNYPTKQALRSLGYGPSAKVGIKFTHAWWIHDLDKVGSHNIVSGGLGHSDLNIRTCVYPSYNIKDPDTSQAVLLVSYTWQQDAERLGSLMSTLPDNGGDASGAQHQARLAEEARLGLKDVLLRDLAKMHTPSGPDYDTVYAKVYEIISKSYLDHHSHDWTHDPYTRGAFAFFRPQQFSALWPSIIQPSGDLVIIGEAASPHHAWVVGALESALHGVYVWLYKNAGHIKGADEAIKALETPEAGNPFVGLPPYMDVTVGRWMGAFGHVHAERFREELRRREGVRE